MEERREPLRHVAVRAVAPIAAIVVVALVFVVVHSVTSSSGAGVVRVTGTVDLGRATSVNNEQVVAQGPNGNVYVAYGTTVKVVVGTASPVTLLHAPREVLALAATSSSLYVATSKQVLEYTLPAGSPDGSWNLPTGIAPAAITAAGISVEGEHIWVWTDWSTDMSGYEYASITEYFLPAWTYQVIANNSAAPGDVAASANGYYYLAHDRVVRGMADGTQVRSTVTGDASEAPVAAAGSNVWIVATREPSGANYLDTYNAVTMTRTRSVHLAHETWGVLGTSTGLWAIANHPVPMGSDAHIVSINDVTGAETELVDLPGAVALLPGPKVAVLVNQGSHLYLDRLS